MKKAGALASALRSSGSAVAATSTVEADKAQTEAAIPPFNPQQVSRLGTKAITVHFPEEVRRQLKSMAGEQGREVSDMVAEALNLLFVRYRRPEIAPRKDNK